MCASMSAMAGDNNPTMGPERAAGEEGALAAIVAARNEADRVGETVRALRAAVPAARAWVADLGPAGAAGGGAAGGAAVRPGLRDGDRDDGRRRPRRLPAARVRAGPGAPRHRQGPRRLPPPRRPAPRLRPGVAFSPGAASL